jgi:hypothetical protein
MMDLRMCFASVVLTVYLDFDLQDRRMDSTPCVESSLIARMSWGHLMSTKNRLDALSGLCQLSLAVQEFQIRAFSKIGCPDRHVEPFSQAKGNPLPKGIIRCDSLKSRGDDRGTDDLLDWVYRSMGEEPSRSACYHLILSFPGRIPHVPKCCFELIPIMPPLLSQTTIDVVTSVNDRLIICSDAIGNSWNDAGWPYWRLMDDLLCIAGPSFKRHKGTDRFRYN